MIPASVSGITSRPDLLHYHEGLDVMSLLAHAKRVKQVKLRGDWLQPQTCQNNRVRKLKSTVRLSPQNSSSTWPDLHLVRHHLLVIVYAVNESTSAVPTASPPFPESIP